ncbi:uncharacterized protein BJX67DRAFT_385540 [Aspergillus lucknowensis]|uniref:Uncharacterized protein n=1 Tax=Aspergillus lucknowensis TaxID=176173 RepID=A0ABR4LDB8_9EURO
MKFIASTAILALVASASAASIPRSAGTRTVVLTNEYSGHGQAADIATDGVDVSVKANYPDLYEPTFRVDSVMITSGVVPGALCKVHGKTPDGHPIDLVQVDGQHNYAKFPKDKPFIPATLKLNCV